MNLNKNWKPIKGWKGIYDIHPTGLIRRVKPSHTMLPSFAGAGYHTVTLTRVPIIKKHYVHQLVMNNFGPPKPRGKFEIDHIDRVKTNNDIKNLRWVTHKENSQNRAYVPEHYGKLDWGKAQQIKKRLKSNPNQTRLAEEFGVSKQTITLIKQGVIWRE